MDTPKRYKENLAFNEVITGDTYAIKHGNKEYTGCVVFIIQQQGEVEFTLTDGIYYKYAFTDAKDQVNKLLKQRIDYLKNNHEICKDHYVRIVAIPEELEKLISQ